MQPLEVQVAAKARPLCWYDDMPPTGETACAPAAIAYAASAVSGTGASYCDRMRADLKGLADDTRPAHPNPLSNPRTVADALSRPDAAK
jgi:hypothetical protein